MALMSQVSAGYPRVSRDCFLPGYGHFYLFVRLRTYFHFSPLAYQHSSCFFPNVDRCVFVSVHHISTVTSVYALRQLQLLFYLSAYAAFLAGRKETVDLYQFLSPLLKLICQNITEHPITVIHDTLSKMKTPAHGFHIQIFHSHCIIPIRKLSCQLMDIIFSLIFYFLVAQRYLSLLLLIVSASLITSTYTLDYNPL